MRIFGITGWKNSGKTTLTTRLIAHFTAQGLDVASIKHAHHAARIDRPGTDSDRHAQAGARQVILATRDRWALMVQTPQPDLQPDPKVLLARLDPCDLVLIEGYKSASHPKLECHRAGVSDLPLIAAANDTIRAVASDDPHLVVPCGLALLDLDDTAAIAALILREARP